MSITVNWAVVPGSTGYTLYRQAGKKVDMTNLPTDKVDIASDASSYTYPTSVNNTLYYIVVGSKDVNGIVTYSEQLMVGNYPDTGPGPQNLMRGDWAFGYFGEVAPADFYSNPELYTALYALYGGSAIASTAAQVIGSWHKCIVSGRIIYIPDVLYTANSVTPQTLLANKMFLTSGDYTTDGTLISKGGYEYVMRLPHAVTADLTTVYTSVPDYAASEIGMLFSLFGNNAFLSQTPPVAGAMTYCKYRLADMGGKFTLAISSTRSSASPYLWAATMTNGTTSQTTGATTGFVPVLELLF